MPQYIKRAMKDVDFVASCTLEQLWSRLKHTNSMYLNGQCQAPIDKHCICLLGTEDVIRKTACACCTVLRRCGDLKKSVQRRSLASVEVVMGDYVIRAKWITWNDEEVYHREVSEWTSICGTSGTCSYVTSFGCGSYIAHVFKKEVSLALSLHHGDSILQIDQLHFQLDYLLKSLHRKGIDVTALRASDFEIYTHTKAYKLKTKEIVHDFNLKLKSLGPAYCKRKIKCNTYPAHMLNSLLAKFCSLYNVKDCNKGWIKGCTDNKKRCCPELTPHKLNMKNL